MIPGIQDGPGSESPLMFLASYLSPIVQGSLQVNDSNEGKFVILFSSSSELVISCILVDSTADEF